MVFARINLNIPFPPAYTRQIWYLSRANIDYIKTSLSSVDWTGNLTNLNVNFLTNSIINVFSNFVPIKVITVRYKDASCMTVEIKTVLLENAKIYRKYVKGGHTQ